MSAAAGKNSFEIKNARNDQKYEYLLVLDFEATCDSEKQPEPQEIIEFPILKLNAKTLEIDGIFHQYVQPTENPKLTDFCTTLTGITQEMVNQQPTLPETLSDFDTWMRNEGLISPDSCSPLKKFTFVTCGNWDLKTMLPGQCKFLNLPVPWYCHEWINVKKAFAKAMGPMGKGLMPMLTILNIKHQGKHHSGIDDCKNIAEIIKLLISQKGVVFQP